MILKFDLFMPQFNEERTIHMFLPDEYLHSQKRYPVLYMFDGHNLFNDEDATYGRSWNLARTIDQCNLDMIVVGQECSHNGNQRLNEYGPYPFADEYFHEKFEGRGPLTMDFFINTLKPYIDTHFPTLPDRDSTWIGGSSCGGVMALYAGICHSDIYSKALVISPYMQPFYPFLCVDAQNNNFSYPLDFYFSWGALEGNDKHAFIQETKMCTDLANVLLHKGAFVQFNVKPEGAHCEADWEEEGPTFLSFLFQ